MDSLVHATAGAAGGIMAMSLLYPLDQVRMLKQTDTEQRSEGSVAAILRLSREKGWRVLYQGLHSVLVSMGCSNFVYFYASTGLKTLRGGGALSARDNLGVACAAGVVNVLATAPLWVANTRIKTDKDGRYADTGFLGVLRRIASEEGVGALWQGTVASLMLVSNPVIQFGVYELIKQRLLKGRAASLSALSAFLLGAVAKALATVCTYPLQLAQSKLRATNARYRSTSECLSAEYRRGGVPALFAGMEAKMLQTVLNSAFMFLFYEKIAGALFRLLALSRQQAAVRASS